VAPNPSGGRPDLLVQVETGIGGTSFLDYRPSTQWNDNAALGVQQRLPFNLWTLTTIERDDGMCDDHGENCVSNGEHNLRTDIQYGGGYFDVGEREFRGFRYVDETDAVGNIRQTEYAQDLALKGKVLFSTFYEAPDDPSSSASRYNKPISEVANDWDCVHPDSGSSGCPPGQRMWPRLHMVQQSVYNNYDPVLSKAKFTENAEWDSKGNVTRTFAGGDGTSTVDTVTEYASNTGAYLISDRPWHVKVTEYSNTAGIITATRLEEKWFQYDTNQPLGTVTKGNVTMVSSWLDQVVDSGLPSGVAPGTACPVSSGGCVTTTMEYDDFGNITHVRDANGDDTETTYDATRIYPSRLTTELQQEVLTEYDPACGVLKSQTLPHLNGHSLPRGRTKNGYDYFCRLTSTILPGAGIAHRIYAYYFGGRGQPSDIWIQESVGGVASPSRRASRDIFLDGFGRRLQTLSDRILDGDDTITTVAEGTVEFDARGKPVISYSPFEATLDISTGRPAKYQKPPAGTSFSASSYDAAGRITSSTAVDGVSLRTFDHSSAWQTTTRDECVNAGTCQGSTVVEIRDAFGRTTEKRVFDGASFDTGTKYTYDGNGRVTKVVQQTALGSPALATTVTTTYDSLGRKIRVVDPDSGTWRYGYDLIGNLIYQDDPKSGQHLQYCYDKLSRVTKKRNLSSSGFDVNACSGAAEVVYTYGAALGVNFGRLTRVVDTSGESGGESDFGYGYDVTGRVVKATAAITVDGQTKAATTKYVYDAVGQFKKVRYPDREAVRYNYNKMGQLVSIRGKRNYLTNATYDIFGRLRDLQHGNATVDSYSYDDAAHNFRLKEIKAAKLAGSAGPLMDYRYPTYTANGLLARLEDAGPKGPMPQQALDNTADMTYDGLGRLLSYSGPNAPSPNTYEYGDHLGNMTKKEGVTFTYLASKPHVLSTIDGADVVHDDNGNRSLQGGSEYDIDDRLIDINNGLVRFLYDYTGQRVAKISGNEVTRYFGNLAELTSETGQDVLTKYYYAGSRLIASQRVTNPRLAALSQDPVIQVAAASGKRLGVALVLRPDAARAATTLLALGTLLILSVPGRRKPVVGIAIRRGPVWLLIVVFAATTLPLPLLVCPAQAASVGQIYHYHVDHLGSTHLITSEYGDVVEYIRYRAYGAMRGHYDAAGNPKAQTSCADGYCHEFTGYDTEPLSGLQYAGARFYDPVVGMFLTHDPAREFANPYTYTGWNPTNLTDPNGACIIIADCVVLAIVLVSLSAVAVSIDTGIQTGSISQAFQAGLITGVVGGVTAGVGAGIVGPAVGSIANPAVQQAVGYAVVGASIGAGGYGAYQSFNNGYYASGVVGAVLTAFSVAEAFGASDQGGNGQQGTVQGEQYASGINDAGRNPNEFDTAFDESGKKYGVSGAKLKAIAITESQLNPNAVNFGNPASPNEAVGLMQIQVPKADTVQINSLMDVRANIDAGAARFQYFLDKANGNVLTAIGRYKGVQSFQGLINTIPAMVYVNSYPHPPASLVGRFGLGGGYAP
jgi:RHS repeat-associated protein